jgi:hypothetical protein
MTIGIAATTRLLSTAAAVHARIPNQMEIKLVGSYLPIHAIIQDIIIKV